MVLTADDFGQAYLTRGWARTFLLDLYARYTVLFVGYSHSDVPLQYLAYGLKSTGGNPRYVLDYEPPERWADYGIKLIPYIREPETAPDRYINLKDGLRSWAREVERKPLQFEAQIDQILNSSAAPSAAEEDFLLRSLKRPSTARHFVVYGKNTGLKWVDWLDSKGELRQYLYLNAASAVDAGRVVAHWVGRQIVHSKNGGGLQIVGHREEPVGDIVWDAMAWELARSEDDLLLTEEGPKWVAFLLSSARTKHNWHVLNMLLTAAAKRKLWAITIRVFDVLTVPTVKVLESPLILPEHSRAELSIALEGDMQNLILSWQEGIVPALRDIATLLAPILETKINHAHDLAVLAGKGNRFNDPVLYSRQNIEFDAHPIFARGVDVLLNFFAGVLEALIAARNGALEDWADRLLRSSNPILLRFGLYVLRRCTSISASVKLSWLVDRSLFFPLAYGGTRELYEVLKQVYPELEPHDRENLWVNLEESLPPAEDTSDEANLRRENIDRVCWHLTRENRSDPQAVLAWSRLEERNARLAAREPWLPGEHMRDFSGTAGERSPRSVTELLTQPPAAQLELILEFKGETWPSPSRAGLLGAVAVAAGEDKVWRASLMHALAKKDAWQADVWSYLLRAFRYHDLPPAEGEWFLREAAPKLACHPGNVDPLARFFYHGQTVEELRAVDRVELNRRLDFSAVLWAAARTGVKLEDRDPVETEWLNTAINRAPGWIAEFWLMHQQLVAEATKEGEPTWPEAIRPAVDQVASGESDADLLVLAVFASRITFLRRSAPAWIRDHLYPCLNFKSSGRKAWALWSSLLQYASWSRDVALELKEPLRAAFAILSNAPDDIAKRFHIHVAGIAAHSVFDVQADGWLEAFLHSIKPARRASWTLDLAREVGHLVPDERQRLWQGWVKAYWTDRVNRKVPPIDPDESEAFARLAASFKEDFPEAVSLLLLVPKPSITHFIPMEYTEGYLPMANPEVFLQALDWLLAGMNGLFFLPDEMKKLYEKMPRHRSLLPLWDAFCQKLSDLNVPEARDLQAAGRAWFTEER